MNNSFSLEDDLDWLQISDDAIDESSDQDNETGLFINMDKNDSFDESLKFSSCGTLQMKGLSQVFIKPTGIQRNTSKRKQESPLLAMEDRLLFMHKVGNGSCGEVLKAVDIAESRVVAVKKITLNDKSKRRQFIQELKSFLDPCNDVGDDERNYLVAFFDAFSFSGSCAAGLIFEFMDCGSLDEIVKRGGCQNEKILSFVAYSCLRGIQELHEKNKLHRDIKPSNVLLNSLGQVKLADFGLVSAMDKSDHASTFVGTTQFMSPERIRGEPYNRSSDIWSLGLTVLSAALGHYPLQSGFFEVVLRFKQSEEAQSIILNEPKFNKMSSTFQDFILLCCRLDPSHRPDVNELLKHDFIGSNKDSECLRNYLKMFQLSNDVQNIVARIRDEIDEAVEHNDSKFEYKKLILEKCCTYFSQFLN